MGFNGIYLDLLSGEPPTSVVLVGETTLVISMG